MAGPGSALRTGSRYLGALLLLATGAVHLHQYYAVYYRVIPVIGPLFMANFVTALVLGLTLLAPLGRTTRGAELRLLLAAGAGIAFAAGTLIALALSEHGTLFGFHENGYRTAIVIAIVVEAGALVNLAVFAALQWPGVRDARRA